MKIIDCDSHFLTSDIHKNIEAQYHDQLPRYVFDADHRVIDIEFQHDPCTIPDPRGRHFTHCDEAGINNVDVRLEDFKKLKIHQQLLGPQERAMRFNYSVEKNLAAQMAHSYNIEIKKIVDQHPDKFFAVALLPLQDIDFSLKEIDWAVTNGFKAVYIDCVYYTLDKKTGLPLTSQPEIDKIFARCQEHDLIIYQHHFMHRVSPAGDQLLNELVQNQPMDRVQVGVYNWITHGVFDKFPKLRVILSESAERWIRPVFEHLQKAFNESKLMCEKEPIFYFKKNIYITVEVEKPITVDYLIKTFGSDRLLFCTDYPHIDAAGKNKWNDVDDLYKLNLTQTDLENIAFRNAERLFELV
jgi:predicted TIM-barrel fold metal-dependent hydrolase